MSAIKALRLDHWGVKQAMRHPLIAGKKPIGRGVFSAVFEGTRKNTVLKMTCDDIGYWMLNDPYVGVKHRHFPKVVESHGEIGTMTIGREEHTIYLFEMEKLNRLETGSEAKRLSRQITMTGNSASYNIEGSWRSCSRTAAVLANMVEDKALPKSIRNALTQLCDFCHNISGGTLDMHGGNFMQRDNGELVMTDPLANMKIHERAVSQLYDRRW